MFEEYLDFQIDSGHGPDWSEINRDTECYSSYQVMLTQVKLMIGSVGFCTKICGFIYSCFLHDFIWLSPDIPFLLINCQHIRYTCSKLFFKNLEIVTFFACHSIECFFMLHVCFVLIFNNVKLLSLHRICILGFEPATLPLSQC